TTRCPRASFSRFTNADCHRAAGQTETLPFFVGVFSGAFVAEAAGRPASGSTPSGDTPGAPAACGARSPSPSSRLRLLRRGVPSRAFFRRNATNGDVGDRQAEPLLHALLGLPQAAPVRPEPFDQPDRALLRRHRLKLAILALADGES